MSKARRRILWFLIGLSLFTVFVQWDRAADFLDSATGGIKWSSGLVAFFKANTQGLIQLVILGLYFEFVGITRSKEFDRKEAAVTRELLECAITASSESALLRHGLKARFGDEAAEQLLAGALKPCSVLHNVVVKISPRNSVMGYEVSLKLTYSRKDGRFLVGVTENSFQCEALLATGKLDEVFMASAGDERKIPAKVKKWVKAPHTDSYVSHEVEFSPLSQNEKKEIFRGTALLKQAEKMKIFEGKTPGIRSINNGEVAFEIESLHRLAANYPFMFWLSDRVLEVQSMEVDLSALTKQQQGSSRIHLFMSTLQGSDDINPESAVWNYPHKTWLLPGQGISVIWPPILK